MQKVAFVFIGIGMLALIGWAAQSFFVASDIPLLIKIAAGAIGIGLLILIGIVIKDRRAKAN